MNDDERLAKQIAALEKRLAKLEGKEPRKRQTIDMFPGTSWIMGEDVEGAKKVYTNINELIKAVCAKVRDTGEVQVCSEWFVQSFPVYSAFDVLIGVKCMPPVRKHVRTISVKEAAAYFRGEENILLRRFSNYDAHAYRYKKTISRLNKDGSSKNYMRVRGR